MARVIERLGTRIVDGFIVHDERDSSYAIAEAIVGRRLDRRKNYCIVKGQVCEAIEWTRACSGCYDGLDPNARGSGCSECGYTGRSRCGQWHPIENAKS